MGEVVPIILVPPFDILAETMNIHRLNSGRSATTIIQQATQTGQKIVFTINKYKLDRQVLASGFSYLARLEPKLDKPLTA